jgi:hypothetical protein
VDIGEAIIKYLPTSERFYCLASELVRFFVYLLADASSSPHEIPQFSYLSVIENEPPGYIGQAEPKLRHLRITSSRRFADCISGATDREAALREPWTAAGRAGSTAAGSPGRSLRREIDIVFHGRPPASVQEVVRGLFLRDMVDVLWSGCGYNDFCLWCRFDVTPLDPAMFWYAG